MKTILITGVTSGTGFALAKAFINEGYRVAGSVRNSIKAIELEKLLGPLFTPLVFDITNHWEIDIAVNNLRNKLGIHHLDALINNAGGTEIGPLLHVPMSDFRRQLEVLVIAQLNIIQKFYKFLLPENSSQQAGTIINMSSVSGQSSNYFFGCYSAAKHALEGLSKTLREELKLYGVKVIVVAPGNIQTSLWDKQTAGVIEKYKDTGYYSSLKRSLEHISTTVVKTAMTPEEFSRQFLEIFSESDPAERYTIYKESNQHGENKIVVLRS
jgi:NAD(P)-dependent dehydrogenase (short-subunit alcohol dehydrogenase family)